MPDPHRYGIIEADGTGRVVSLEEKPARPRSNLAAIGLYFLDHEAPARARSIRPSARGELEITTLLDTYLADGTLEASWLGNGYAWFDTGTHDSLFEAAAFVREAERAGGIKHGCLEEIAFRRGLIDDDRLTELAQPL